MSVLEELSREELIALTRALMAENAALKAEVAHLRERVAKLERIVSRNSGNSGMPPSADDLPGRKKPKERPAGSADRRRPGKQPGAEGERRPGRTTSMTATSSITSRRVRVAAAPILPWRPIWE